MACAENPLSMAKQIECSEEAWLIRITLIFSRARVANNLMDTPTTPSSPLPWTLIRLMSFIEEIPLMIRDFPLASSLIFVPAKEGLKEFFIQIGILLAMAGCMVEGNMTFAPKCESSMASS